MNRLPPWFKQDITQNSHPSSINRINSLNINTVCAQAHCPNINSCFKNSRMTFMILGKVCTRNCSFCALNQTDDYSSLSLDKDEPYRVARAVSQLGLNYVVITSVTRDDLEDGGSAQFVSSIKALRAMNKEIKIEVLIPDFHAKLSCIKCVLDAGVDVAGHNLETISRLYAQIRPSADYARSLKVLAYMKKYKPAVITKSSLMLGMGEAESEVIGAMQDLRDSSCDILTLGQYLAPSPEHYPVKEFIAPEQFEKYRHMAKDSGFKAVLAGPLVRSSFQAEEVYRDVVSV